MKEFLRQTRFPDDALSVEGLMLTKIAVARRNQIRAALLFVGIIVVTGTAGFTLFPDMWFNAVVVILVQFVNMRIWWKFMKTLNTATNEMIATQKRQAFIHTLSTHINQ